MAKFKFNSVQHVDIDDVSTLEDVGLQNARVQSGSRHGFNVNSDYGIDDMVTSIVSNLGVIHTPGMLAVVQGEPNPIVVRGNRRVLGLRRIKSLSDSEILNILESIDVVGTPSTVRENSKSMQFHIVQCSTLVEVQSLVFDHDNLSPSRGPVTELVFSDFNNGLSMESARRKYFTFFGPLTQSGAKKLATINKLPEIDRAGAVKTWLTGTFDQEIGYAWRLGKRVQSLFLQSQYHRDGLSEKPTVELRRSALAILVKIQNKDVEAGKSKDGDGTYPTVSETLDRWMEQQGTDDQVKSREKRVAKAEAEAEDEDADIEALGQLQQTTHERISEVATLPSDNAEAVFAKIVLSLDDDQWDEWFARHRGGPTA